MPYKVDTLKIILPKKKGFDRRYKLTEQERDEIFENVEGLRVMQLARKYNVSHTTIMHVQHPEVYIRRLNEFKERRKDGRYYDAERHRKAIMDTRHYRHKMLRNFANNDIFKTS